MPFLLNAEVQGRFLLAMPLLILAELGVHLRMRQLVAQFFNRDLIADEDRPRVEAARLNRRCACGTPSPPNCS